MKHFYYITSLCALSVAALVAETTATSPERVAVVHSTVEATTEAVANPVDEEARWKLSVQKEREWMQDRFKEANNTTYAKDHRYLKIQEGEPGYTYEQFNKFLKSMCNTARTKFLPDSPSFLEFKAKRDEFSSILKQTGTNLEEFSRANFNKFICLVPHEPLNEGASFHYAHVWHVIRDVMGESNLMASKNELEDYEIFMNGEDFLKWDSRSVDPYYVTKKSIDHVSKNGGYVPFEK